jgi:hypothetical protein
MKDTGITPTRGVAVSEAFPWAVSSSHNAEKSKIEAESSADQALHLIFSPEAILANPADDSDPNQIP